MYKFWFLILPAKMLKKESQRYNENAFLQWGETIAFNFVQPFRMRTFQCYNWMEWADWSVYKTIWYQTWEYFSFIIEFPAVYTAS